MQVIQPQISAFYATIPFSQPLYQKLKVLEASDEVASLSDAQRRHINQTLESFKRNGAEVDTDTKHRLEALERSLSEITMKFAQNVVEETDAFEWVTNHSEELKGIPESALAIAADSAKKRDQEGWRFTLQGPSYISILTYCDTRSVREHFYRAYSTRATQGERDNQLLISQILELRAEKAKLLGYQDVSDLYLAPRMVKRGESAHEFVQSLIIRTEQHAQAEHQELERFARDELGWTDSIEAWDLSYIAEKLRKQTCDFDEELLKPYLEVKSVMQGMFGIVERLYQVQVKPLNDLPTWHEDVMTFELTRGDDQIGVFYADLFPREGKQGGAWMCPLLYGETVNKQDTHSVKTPHVGLICANFTPPTQGRSLITHQEVETLFHEFGHLLHHLLTDTEIRSQAGTNVAWDFVELPSQIMENWCWEREALDLFARHVDEGTPLPDELFERLLLTRTFRAASGQMRQLCFAEIDLKLHREYQAENDETPIAYARRIMEQRSPTRLPEEYAMIAGFGHLFASPTGYAAAYYSYKWAEVLDADAFTRFKKEGLFSPEVGAEFRNCILSQGNSADPVQLFEQFMGRPADPEALFVRLGIA
jgi:oligopeptidase A